jgi:hypothetical protein
MRFLFTLAYSLLVGTLTTLGLVALLVLPQLIR